MNPIRHTIWSLLLLVCLLFGSELYAQAPEAINYQAIARDTSGQILASQGIALSLSVYSGPLGDTLVYVEDHLVSTNAYGLFTLQIGEGTPATGTFAGINWGTADHFLEVSIDVGNGAVNLGKRRFNSVPYALFAPESEKATAMSLDDLLDADTIGALTGDVLKWDGLKWAPAVDGGASYTAGTAISITGNTINNTGDTNPADDIIFSSVAGGDVSGTFSNLTVNGLQGNAVSPTAPSNGQVLTFNSTSGQWVPGAATSTILTAGTAISITGNAINNTGDTDPNDDITTSSVAGGDASGTFSALSVTGLRGNALAVGVASPADGSILVYNIGSGSWVLGSDANTEYTASTGIDITAGVITNTGDTNPFDDITISTAAGGDLFGTYPSPEVVRIRGISVTSNAPAPGQVLKYDGVQWDVGTDAINDADSDPTNEIQSISLTGNLLQLSNGGGLVNLPTYLGGVGISVTGTIINNTGDTDPGDDITIGTAAAGDLTGTYPSPSVIGIQGFPISNAAPSLSQVLTWNGAQWAPAAITSSNLWTQNSTDLYFNTGNVSIGTNAAVSTLSVAGSSSILNGSNQIRIENGIQNGTGFVRTTGNNGTTNTVLSNRAGSTDNGFIAVYDSTGALKAGMMVNAAGDGEIFGDFKNFRVAHPTDPEKEIWYASLEGPEAAAYLRGTATLENGTAKVAFPDHFQLIVQEAGMTVMLTPLSADSRGLAVVAKSDGGFEVKELLKGSGNYSFDWEVKSIRKGHEDFDIIRNRIPDLQN